MVYVLRHYTRECAAPGCAKQPSWNRPGEVRPATCKAHADAGMINVRQRHRKARAEALKALKKKENSERKMERPIKSISKKVDLKEKTVHCEQNLDENDTVKVAKLQHNTFNEAMAPMKPASCENGPEASFV